ncbi:MAG TPA: glucose-6-phosphate dehydrogenase [Burkholderiales bacterium]
MRKSSIDPCLFVIFGATGDLMRRKLLPALRQLIADGLLPDRCHILGVGRDEKLTDERFRKQARAALKQAGTQKAQRWCDACVDYLGTGAGDAADYERLAARITEIERRRGLRGDRVLYLALPPAAFPGTIEALGKAGLNRSKGWTRLVIEKPFGHDLASAQALNALVHRYFDETQVYRIDHYLGKEAVQNLLAFRFGNALFESAWNRDHIESVRISVAEALGIEHRAAYYEQTGALRDMVQNHLTQLLSLTAMEVPAAFQADSIRFEKVKVLRSVAPIRKDAVVFGQYARGKAKRKKLPGYRQEPGVAARSHTETFVGLRLEIDNWRWQGVPFHLSTGKRLARRSTEIAIHFRRPPVALFRSLDGCATNTNVLVMALQPDEGFDLSFEVKAPAERFTLETQHMQFRYAEAFGAPRSGGYETLLLEIVRGDQTLFVHADEAEASWRLYGPLLKKRWPLHSYPAGGPGPEVP